MKMNRKAELLAVLLFAVSAILIVSGMVTFVYTKGTLAYASLSLSIIITMITIASIYTGLLDKIINMLIKK